MTAVLLVLLQTWVVEEVIPPRPSIPGTEFQFGWGVACGDLDGDSRVESYIHGQDAPWTEQTLGIQRGGSWDSLTVLAAPALRFITGAPMAPRVALLESPQGQVLLALDSNNGGLLHSRPLADLGRVLVRSPDLRPLAFTRAGDVNGDGWEDLFCQDYRQGTGYPMMIDGRTLTVLWQHALATAFASQYLAEQCNSCDKEEAFMAGLARLATPGRHADVMQHMVGHLRDGLDRASRDELLGCIDDHRRGLVPLIVPVTLLRHHVRRCEVAYLGEQTYLDPHPRELCLRNHV